MRCEACPGVRHCVPVHPPATPNVRTCHLPIYTPRPKKCLPPKLPPSPTPPPIHLDCGCRMTLYPDLPLPFFAPPPHTGAALAKFRTSRTLFFGFFCHHHVFLGAFYTVPPRSRDGEIRPWRTPHPPPPLRKPRPKKPRCRKCGASERLVSGSVLFFPDLGRSIPSCLHPHMPTV